MPDDLSPDDERALAALYREADGEEPPQWSSVRDVVTAARRSGFDEEPPARVDALLLAAARAHAPRPRAGWWTRLATWMRPLVAHPAMAGALALVVVVGIGGVMYRRGQVRTVHPIPQVLDPPARHAPPGEMIDRREFERQADPVVVPESLAPAAPTVMTPAPAAPERNVKPRPRPSIEGTTRRDPPSGGASSGADGDSPPPVVTVDDDLTEAAPPPPPEPGAVPVPAPAPPQAMAAPDSAVALPRLQALVADARGAAAKGDCTTVAALSAKVRAIDAAFHRTSFATDPSLAACLTRTAN